MGANLQLRKLADRTVDPEVYQDEDGKERTRHPLAGVKLIGEAPAEHAFRYSWLAEAAGEGWAELTGDTVVLHLVDGDVTYRIVGRWANGAGVHVELVEAAKPTRTRRR